jgi:hypothetical protein
MSGNGVVSKADEYRARAAECEKLAEQASEPTARNLLRQVADNWRTMAMQADRFGR